MTRVFIFITSLGYCLSLEITNLITYFFLLYLCKSRINFTKVIYFIVIAVETEYIRSL